jgi:hypothetical protein
LDTIENLLLRNIHGVSRERNFDRRAAAFAVTFSSNSLFSDPRGTHLGHPGLEDAVASLQSQFSDYSFSQIDNIDVLADCGRVTWAFGPPEEPWQITGLDIVIVKEVRISAL